MRLVSIAQLVKHQPVLSSVVGSSSIFFIFFCSVTDFIVKALISKHFNFWLSSEQLLWWVLSTINFCLQMGRFTTPCYRAPEMLDTWNNFPVGPAGDIWALGCILYTLCFMRHPFEDSAKLRIINANYTIPPETVYSDFHPLISKNFEKLKHHRSYMSPVTLSPHRPTDWHTRCVVWKAHRCAWCTKKSETDEAPRFGLQSKWVPSEFKRCCPLNLQLILSEIPSMSNNLILKCRNYAHSSNDKIH